MASATGDIAVRGRGIRKDFGDGDSRIEVLRSVDLTAHLGELLFLMGPSGSGKTTLLSVIAGLLDASAGDLVVLGRRYADLSKQERIRFRRKNLGFVFQQYHLLPALTALENAAVPLLAAGVTRRVVLAAAETVLAELGLAERMQALPAELSGGQQQRVAIARALIHGPHLVLCDEPTAALDHDRGYAVMELLAERARREDRAVIVVTHDNRILDFADRVAYMEDGRIERIHTAQQSARRVSERRLSAFGGAS